MELSLPAYGWTPRDYQLPLWNARVVKDCKRAIAVWHRRAGKDHVSINMLLQAALKEVGLYWHVLPTYAQGRKIVWDGRDSSGRAFVDYIPEEIREKTRNDRMEIRLFNGSVYAVVGGDRVDKLVGSNPKGIVFSEYSLQNPACWHYLMPILMENDGWAVFIYTARGHNHGYSLYKNAYDEEDWFCEILTVDDTRREDGSPVISQKQIDEAVKIGDMPEEIARQEFWCDFEAAMAGSYWGPQIQEAQMQGRISDKISWNPEKRVYTSWDLGLSDLNSIWFFQINDEWIDFIDYEEGAGKGLQQWIEQCEKEKPYIYHDFHIGPRDLKVREYGSGAKTRWEAARDLGWTFRIAPSYSLQDGIDATRRFLRKCRFNKTATQQGVDSLRNYRKEWKESGKVWSIKPVHDWSSHGADGMRYCALTLPRSLVKSFEEKEPAKNDLTFDDAFALAMGDIQKMRRRNRRLTLS